MGLYLEDGESMIENIKATKRVIDELQEQRVTLSYDEKRQNFIRFWGLHGMDSLVSRRCADIRGNGD